MRRRTKACCASLPAARSITASRALLGRLLYESNLLFEDQLTTLRNDSKRHGAADNELDYSLLLDGLAAEREQKITIDVAYRFFSTAKRKFIVIDAPGHEQYTRNSGDRRVERRSRVAAGRCTVGFHRTDETPRAAGRDARREAPACLRSTRWISVGWSQETFDRIEQNFRSFAAGLDVENILVIPLSAKGGDNVVQRSAKAPWYSGPTLLDHLENVSLKPAARYQLAAHAGAMGQPPRREFPWLLRHDRERRSVSGHAGETVAVRPDYQDCGHCHGRRRPHPRRRRAGGDADSCKPRLTPRAAMSSSRTTTRPHAAGQIKGQIFWMADTALQPGRRLLAKAGTATAQATVGAGLTRINLDTLASAPVGHLAPNEIGFCQLTFDRPLALERYKDNRDLGSFILIDAETNDTVAMGLITELGSAETKTENAVSRLRTLAQNVFAKRKTADAISTHPRSFAKALTWRAIGSLTTFTLVWLLTGSPVIAATIGAAEIIVKVAIYYMHERAWLSVSWGRH